MPLLHLGLFIFCMASVSPASALRLLSLNLHGYHPMAEAPRFHEDARGVRRPAEIFLTYFEPVEIERGHELQLTALERDLSRVQADVILLQEVAAGLPGSPKTCQEFYREDLPDRIGKNTALRLRDRLRRQGQAFEAALACRGNRGWQTFPDTFQKERILRPSDSSGRHFEVVHGFGSNPYPNGLLVEGTAVLVRAPWRILENREWRIPVPGGPDFFFQSVALRKDGDPKWYLLANLHAGWEIRHFEQAVAVREHLAKYLLRHPARETLGGAILGGDFNARPYRPAEKSGDLWTIPWEIASPGQFDYGPQAPPEVFEELKGRMAAFSPSAPHAVDRLQAFVRGSLFSVFSLFRETLDEGFRKGLCDGRGFERLEPACAVKDRIDLIYSSAELHTRRSTVLWSTNHFYSTRGLSDHPGVFVELVPEPAFRR